MDVCTGVGVRDTHDRRHALVLMLLAPLPPTYANQPIPIYEFEGWPLKGLDILQERFIRRLEGEVAAGYKDRRLPSREQKCFWASMLAASTEGMQRAFQTGEGAVGPGYYGPRTQRQLQEALTHYREMKLKYCGGNDPDPATERRMRWLADHSKFFLRVPGMGRPVARVEQRAGEIHVDLVGNIEEDLGATLYAEMLGTFSGLTLNYGFCP